MKRKIVAAVVAALAMAATLVGAVPASADQLDYRTRDRQDSHSAFMGTLTFNPVIEMVRRDNGTPSNQSDDDINFNYGGYGSTLNIRNTYTGWTYCSGSQDPDGDGLCWLASFPLGAEDVNWCEAKIQRKDGSGNYETVWSNLWNNDGVKNVQDQWRATANDPRIRVECSYSAEMTGWNGALNLAWNTDWQ